MFPGRRCRVKPRRWTPSVPRGTSGPPPGSARIHRGRVRGPNTTLRAIFSRPARWIDRDPTPVAVLAHVPAAGSARHARPQLLVRCEHTGRPRVALRGPGGPATGPSARRCVRSAAVGPSPDDRRAASRVPRGTGGGRRRRTGSLCSTWNTRTAGRPRRAPLASERPTLPARANDRQDRHREGGSCGRRTVALRIRPRRRAGRRARRPAPRAARPRSSREQLSVPGTRAAGALTASARRRPRRGRMPRHCPASEDA